MGGTLQVKDKVLASRRTDDPERTFEFEGLCFTRLKEHPLTFRKGSDLGESEDSSAPSRHIDELGDPELSKLVRAARDHRHIEWIRIHATEAVVRTYAPLYWITVDSDIQDLLGELRRRAGVDARLAAGS